jgi:hypothetical protein
MTALSGFIWVPVLTKWHCGDVVSTCARALVWRVTCQAHLDKPACVVVGDAATEWICDYAPWIRSQGFGVDGRSDAALTAQTKAAAAAAPALAKRLGDEQNFPYKSSHDVLRAALVGLEGVGFGDP